jgi:hypothetical protein
MNSEHFEDLKCVICLDLFEQPVSLYCGHSYCKTCILGHLEKTPKCPLCKFPILGFQELKTNIAIQKIVDKITEDNHLVATRASKTKPIENKGRSDSIIREDKLYPESRRDLPYNSDLLNNEYRGLLSENENDDSDKWGFDYQNEFYKKYEEEVLFKDMNLSIEESSRKKVKCIGFEISTKESCFFPETLYKIKLKYKHSDELFKAMLPDHHFIGIVEANKTTPKRAYLFQLISISGFEYNLVEVVSRCKSHLQIDFINTIDFTENDEFISKYALNGSEIKFEYVCGTEISYKSPIMEDGLKSRFEDIEMKLVYYLNLIKTNNPQIYEIIHLRYNIDSYQEKLSVDWKTDTYKYLNIVSSMLNINPIHKEILCFGLNVEHKVRIIFQYLKGATPENDPIFFINYGSKTQVSHFWTNVMIFIALVIFIISAYFPKFNLLHN